MERLTTGRRHIRAGSVRVKELISKQPPPFELPDQEHTAAPGTGALDTLLAHSDHAPNSHRRPTSKGAQLAKIAGLGVASFVLCASVALGSMITSQRREMTPSGAGARAAADISGEEALLPDVLNRVVPSTGITGVPDLPTPTRATGKIENTGPPTVPADPAPNVPVADTSAAGDEQLSKTALVERFYRLVPTSPDRAFALLDGDLLGTDPTEFVRSWGSVSDVELLDVRERGDEVLAVVQLRLPDGSYLRVQQLLDVANTVPRRIIGAEILSAQRN